jgi:hypothetical protein
VPLFAGMPQSGHWQAIQICAQATGGDVVIALLAYWAVSAWVQSGRWILSPRASQVVAFVAIGVAITVVMEWLATHMLGRWAYADTMPIVPVLDVGLAPVLQWVLVPLLIVWFVRRQLT